MSKFRTPIEQPTNAVYRDDSTYHRTEDSSNYPTGGIDITKTDCPPAPPGCRYPEKKPKCWWKRWKTWKFLLNVATFIAVVAYACITYRMWIEMQKQTRTQRETGINTERAWLGLDADLPIKISVLKIGPPRFEAIATYRIKNFGHGPAFKIASIGWITTSSEEMERWASFSCESNLAYTEGTLRVGPKIPQPPPMGRILFPDQILEQSIGQPGSPFIGPAVPDAKFIWFVGCISYKDQFRTSHWTRFCMLTPEWVRVTFFDEHTPLHFYGMYNDTDDDTERKKQDQ